MNAVINIAREYYRWVVALSVIITLTLASSLPRTQFTSDFEAYFSPDNPQMQTFKSLQDAFNKQDSLTFLVIPKNNDIFRTDTITLMRTLTERSWEVPYSRRVDSITNFLRTTSEDDELNTEELFPLDTEITPALLQSVKRFVLNDTAAKQFSSPSGDAGVVYISLTLPVDSQQSNTEVVIYAQEILNGIDYDRDKIDVHIMGTTMINHALEQAVQDDVSFLIPASYLLIFIVMLILIRSLSGTLLTIAVITLTNISVFGAISWANIVLTSTIGAVPSIITIIAVADCMHFLVSYFHELNTGKNKTQAIDDALRINFTPMLVTSVTTAIGFLCLNFSESPPYRDLGNVVAFGTIMAFVFTITFLPAMLHWIPQAGKHGSYKQHEKYFSRMDSLGNWAIQHYKLLTFGILIISVFSAGLIFNNQLSNNWVDNYDDSYAFKRALNTQEKKMYGSNFIDYKLDSGSTQGINDPAYMNDVDKLTQWLSEKSTVGYVSSFSNNVKTINRILHNNNDEYYVIPNSRELLAQSNLLYEMSLPFGMGLDEQVDINKQSLRLRISLHSMTSKELLAFDKELALWTKKNTPHILVSAGSGLDMIFAHIIQRNIVSLVKGTVIALILISILMIWILKSIKLGLLSLIPNIFPIALAYALWSILDGNVDLSVSVVGTMSLGLVVDDTVHFLSKYQLARNEKGQDVYQAIRYAFRTVGVAMMVTSIILTLGFAILVFSHFRPTWAMGELLSITIVFALLIDFLLLPGLLIIFDRSSRN